MNKFITKRNGAKAEYDGDKIIQAILKAMNETLDETNFDIARKIEAEISEGINAESTVEKTQDLIERLLFKHGCFDTAKKYIAYRITRESVRNRKQGKKYLLLSEKFLSKYKHSVKVFPGNLGIFVYMRTYSRFLPEEKRRENWWETVARAVDYNCSLSKHTTRAEAEELFDNIFHFRQFLSGRTMFVGGTEVTKSSGLANFNCAGIKLNEYEKFSELFLLLMLGTGVGIRVLPEDVKLLPKIRQDIEVIHNQFEGVPKILRKEHTTTHFVGDTARIVIGDSRFGWAKALDTFFEILTHRNYSNIVRIIFVYDNIRPKGEALKTFGGYASGFEPLHRMFVKIDKIIKSKDSRLAPVQLMDIATIIAENVTSGGVRRSSLITAFDKDDTDLYSAKSNIYSQIDDKWVINKDLAHRAMSNNSIHFLEEPTFEEIKAILNEGRYSGEPGWQFVYNAKKRRKDFVLTNPCGEILLDDRGNCNLTTVNVAAFVKADGIIDWPRLIRAQKLSARASYRMTFVDLELHKWDIIHKRDRLAGASLTGVQDLFNEVGITHDEKAQREFFRVLKKAAWDAIHEIAAEHGTEPSLLVTTIKPEGTLSQLPTVSSGIHASHSPFFIRRVRITASDPLVKVAQELGWNIQPENGQVLETADTLVLEFPIKAPKGRTKYNFGAIEQLEFYRITMEEYVDHNTSITVHVRENEWDDVAKWLNDNKDWVVAVSFLSLDDNFYQLAPYEEIDEATYNKMVAEMKDFNPALLAKYETGEASDEGNDGCEAGVCPVR